jgi:hypothetical protein
VWFFFSRNIIQGKEESGLPFPENLKKPANTSPWEWSKKSSIRCWTIRASTSIAVQHPDPNTGNPSTSQQDSYLVNALGETIQTTDRNGVVQARNVWSPVYVDALILRDQSSQYNGVLG